MSLFGIHISRSLFVLGVIEIAILASSLYAGQFLRWATPDRFWLVVFDNWPSAVTYALVFWVMMVALGLYNREIAHSNSVSLVRLIVAFALGFILLSMIMYALPPIRVWRSAVAIAVPMSFLIIAAVRPLYLKVTGLETFKRRILVLGTGTLAARIADLETQDRLAEFVSTGYVQSGQDETKVPSEQIVPKPHSLIDLARSMGAEEIVVALGERRGEVPVEALMDCKTAQIRVLEYPTFWERETGQVDLDAVRPSWLIYTEHAISGPVQPALKRLFDVGASLFLLAFSLPILASTAIAVKLTSPGPIFYRQVRVGQHGRHFMLTKFRSMDEHAERDGLPRWAGEGDPRVTSVGRFIRTTRIDELPQIFNVLAGQMSFIGPRPERPFFVETLSRKIPFYGVRHQVKPGISGWAQLNYPYGASVEDARMKLQYDLFYIKNYSVLLDLIVLIQTLRVVLWPKGAR